MMSILWGLRHRRDVIIMILQYNIDGDIELSDDDITRDSRRNQRSEVA